MEHTCAMTQIDQGYTHVTRGDHVCMNVRHRAPPSMQGRNEGISLGSGRPVFDWLKGVVFKQLIPLMSCVYISVTFT